MNAAKPYIRLVQAIKVLYATIPTRKVGYQSAEGVTCASVTPFEYARSSNHLQYQNVISYEAQDLMRMSLHGSVRTAKKAFTRRSRARLVSHGREFVWQQVHNFKRTNRDPQHDLFISRRD